MDLNTTITEIAILAPPFLLALTAHEFSHGYVAYLLGDPTASKLGRLTMNPLKHLDPLGVLAFFIMKIGWAKPVPVDSRYFKDRRKGLLWVSMAGIGANILLAILSGIAARLLVLASPVLPHFFFWPLVQMAAASVWINIMLAVFNLLPIPPLDGSRLISNLLPPSVASIYNRLEPFGFIILLLLFYAGILSKLLLPIISFAQKLIL